MPTTVGARVSRKRSLPFLRMVFALVLSCCFLSADAQSTSGLDSQPLFSPAVAGSFQDLAHELAAVPSLDTQAALQRNRQAIVLLNSAAVLYGTPDYVLKDLLSLACVHSEQDNSQLVRQLLKSYVDESADLEVASKAIRYLLARLDSREQREALLSELLRTLGGESPFLESELATELGLLRLETADPNASSYFLYAYQKNKYNRLAFEQLAQLMPRQISPAAFLEQLRLSLVRNPYDIQSALAFADYAQRLQLYDLAVGAYEYCVDLFNYLYPSQPLASEIYLPWALSCYNSLRLRHKTLQIAKTISDQGRFDLLLESIAAKAAQRLGDEEQSQKLLHSAEQKALKAIDSAVPSADSAPREQLAWFYCFISPDPARALDWANKAFSIDPNSPSAAALLAYALVMNEQRDWAKPLLDNYPPSQISDIAAAVIKLAEGDSTEALEKLRTCIDRDPGSIVAEHARKLLAENGGEYVPPVDPDVALGLLKSGFASTPAGIVPSFVRPADAISLELSVRGRTFFYGSDFGASLAIVNNSTEPLVICDGGLLEGYIRIDAEVTGDIEERIPQLVVTRIRPSKPIEPGSSLIVPVKLLTKRLRQILMTYPQASLNIEFTALLDPVTTPDGQPANRLVDIPPAKVKVERPAVEITRRYLQNQFNTISRKGPAKIKAARLFVGLLKEQHAMANREPLYKFVYADWMPAMLKSALTRCLADENWIVRTQTTAAMASLPLDYELTSAVAENLQDDRWPVRLVTLYILSSAQGSDFDKVLDWYAQNDPESLVRDAAAALRGPGGETPR